MNVNSFKGLKIEEKEIFKKMYSNLYDGNPLTSEEVKVLEKSYDEVSSRMKLHKQETLNKRELEKSKLKI